MTDFRHDPFSCLQNTGTEFRNLIFRNLLLPLSFCISILENGVRAEYWENVGFSVFYLKVLRLQFIAFSLETYKVYFVSQKLYYISKLQLAI